MNRSTIFVITAASLDGCVALGSDCIQSEHLTNLRRLC